MMAEHQRDVAATVAVLGFFASSWFGWAQDSPPRAWRTPLAVAAIASVLLAAAGAWLTWQRWSDGSTLERAETAQLFGVVVVVEVVAIGLGAALLGMRRHGELTPAWIALVVGLHFFPLAVLLSYPLLHLTGAGVVVVAAVSIPVARSRTLVVSAVTGLGTGFVLLSSALASLVLLLG